MTEEVTKNPETIAGVAAELRRHEESDKKKWEKVKAYEKEHHEHDEYEEDDDHGYHHKYGKYKMQEPVNVFTSGFQGIPGFGGGFGGFGGFGGDGMGVFGGLLIGALLGRGGFGGFGGFGGDCHGHGHDGPDAGHFAILQNQNLAAVLGAINGGVDTITAGQRQDLGTIMSGQQAILQGVNNDTLTTNLAICNQGDRLSSLIAAEGSATRSEICDVKAQSAAQFAALQLQSANDTFALSRQMCDDAKESAAQFAALSLQACQNQNALQMQIAECCCETQAAIAALNTSRIQDELDELRLERALANSNGANGQVINQIAVSLGSITQALAALQAKVPV